MTKEFVQQFDENVRVEGLVGPVLLLVSLLALAHIPATVEVARNLGDRIIAIHGWEDDYYVVGSGMLQKTSSLIELVSDVLVREATAMQEKVQFAILLAVFALVGNIDTSSFEDRGVSVADIDSLVLT